MCECKGDKWSSEAVKSRGITVNVDRYRAKQRAEESAGRENWLESSFGFVCFLRQNNSCKSEREVLQNETCHDGCFGTNKRLNMKFRFLMELTKIDAIGNQYIKDSSGSAVWRQS